MERPDIDWAGALERASSFAPFLDSLIGRHERLVALLQAGEIDEALASALATGEGLEAGPLLRRRRNALALVTAIADLAGAWNLTTVTRTLSDFADVALDEAIAAAFAEHAPDATVAGFSIIALGKHGGRELNYSSDIDPIFIYDPDVLAQASDSEPERLAKRISRSVIATLSDRTEDGYVFRVDMRLRPSPEVSPIAIPVEQAISYYESSALAWEQAAFIRSRACAGDRALGQDFLDTIEPFVWRRSLDFGQIDNIARMSRQIREHYNEGQSFGGGYDLKRGRGGIRECEFFAQVHQLIHGGRNRDLRVPDTRTALAALAGAGVIEQDVAAHLSDCYELLRTVEHRLQMVEDRQTHELPRSDAALDRVAKLHGLGGRDLLLGLLEPQVRQTGNIYDRMTGEDEGENTDHRLSEDAAALEPELAALGFDDCAALAERIASWRSGKYRAIRSPAAKEAFERILPPMMAGLADAPDVQRALAGLERLLEQFPSAINFFNLLDARPGLLKLLADILSYAPTLAEELARRPEFFDRLIDSSALELPGTVDELENKLRKATRELDYESLLDRVRGDVGEERFALGVQLTEGRQDPLEISSAYARVAEAALRVTADAAVAEFEAKHGRIGGSELVILALGRLGGGALTHASDLDLVFLYSGESGDESDGDRPLSSSLYYNRLSQRVIAAMSVLTASGPLYEIDTRLRPSGAQGPLAVSFASFEKYQMESAWTWEHMALCRARPIYGAPASRDGLQAIISRTLTAPRNSEELTDAVRNMRADIARHKKPAGPLDVKLLPGGLIDIEFIVHYLQLRTGKGLVPPLEEAASALVREGHLDPAVADAHLLLTRLLVAVRLVAPDCEPPRETARRLIAKSVGMDDWAALVAAVDEARQKVLSCWRDLLGPRKFDEAEE